MNITEHVKKQTAAQVPFRTSRVRPHVSAVYSKRNLNGLQNPCDVSTPYIFYLTAQHSRVVKNEIEVVFRTRITQHCDPLWQYHLSYMSYMSILHVRYSFSDKQTRYSLSHMTFISKEQEQSDCSITPFPSSRVHPRDIAPRPI